MAIKNRKSIYLQAVAMRDIATGWKEIWIVPSAQDLVSIIIELVWLAGDPLPSKVIVDLRNKNLVE